VIALLNPAADNGDIALDLINDIYQHRNSKELTMARHKHPESAKQLRAAAHLFGPPY